VCKYVRYGMYVLFTFFSQVNTLRYMPRNVFQLIHNMGLEVTEFYISSFIRFLEECKSSFRTLKWIRVSQIYTW